MASPAGGGGARPSGSRASSTSSRSESKAQARRAPAGSPKSPSGALPSFMPAARSGRTIDRDAPLLVLKVGTSSLIVSDSSGQRVRLANVAQLVELIGELRRTGYQVVLVSSGAVGMGCIKLGIPKPKSLQTKQAVAAAGQSQLMRMYEDLFRTVGLHCAQLLLSQSDFMDKGHWANVRHTLVECLALGVVPVINENDSTNTAEIRFGDNDNLAALTAVQLEADGLFLFTDVDYLYTANPRADPSAKALRVVDEPWALQVDTREEGSGLGTGGMQTKIIAARTASTAGIPCGLINGQHPRRLLTFLEHGIIPKPGGGDAADGDEPAMPEGTYFKAMRHEQTVGEARRWILSLPVAGELLIDDGAARALASKKSLLPIGVKKVQGSFLQNECVKISHGGSEIGRAIVTFTSEEMLRIIGRHSKEFEEILGYEASPECCYREHILLTVAPESLRSFDVVTKLPSIPPA